MCFIRPRVAAFVWQQMMPWWVLLDPRTRWCYGKWTDRYTCWEVAARAVVHCTVSYIDTFSVICVAGFASWQKGWDAQGVTWKMGEFTRSVSHPWSYVLVRTYVRTRIQISETVAPRQLCSSANRPHSAHPRVFDVQGLPVTVTTAWFLLLWGTCRWSALVWSTW